MPLLRIPAARLPEKKTAFAPLVEREKPEKPEKPERRFAATSGAAPEKGRAEEPRARPEAPQTAKADEQRADSDTLDPLDPATRHAAQLAPPLPAPIAPAEETIAPRARVSMEELLPQLVRRIAWAGDRRRGSVQLELGAGRHAGTTVTVHADEGRVRVELHGTDSDDLRERIETRLRRRGLEVVSVS